jgi:RNA polymerase sigma factor (sigma-70 family)
MLPTWFVADDLMGPAEIALCQAAAKYDATRGIDFRTYAYKRIYGACFSSARRNEYRERAHHTLTDSHVDGGLSPERQSELSAMAGVWEYVCQLPRPHGRVVRSIYEHGLTGAEAAVQLGVSEAWVCRLHREGLEMLRTMFPQQKSG